MKKRKQYNLICGKYKLSTINHYLSTNVADSVVMPESTFGMNRYMYVHGSPTNFRDDTGNFCSKHLFGQIAGAIGGSCSQYYVNTAKYYYVQSVYKVARVVYSLEYDVFVWLLLVFVLSGIYLFNNTKTSIEQRAVIEPVEMTTSGTGFLFLLAFRLRSMTGFVNTLHDTWFAKRTLSVTPLLTVAILFTFTQCGIIGGGKKKGDAPWLLLASGINANTSSIDDTGTSAGSSGGGSGSGGSALVPVVGMYFLHPDHLGSITMITDGQGNVISGGNNGGKSHISYTPYGSIHRTDSSGPDITRFKFTGQEEDKESGLLYYKARYYDPMIGRFAQADSVVMPESTFGMNRYMYVEGNPVRYGDDSGHKRHNGDKERQIQYFTAAVIGFQHDGLRGAALGLMLVPNAKYGSFEGRNFRQYTKRPEKYNALDALADVAKGFQRIAHDVNNFNDGALQGGAQWLGGGLHRAGDTFNLYSGRRKYRGKSDFERSDYGRSDSGRMWSGYFNYVNEVFYGDGLSMAIAKSDFGRSDLGKVDQKNRHCISLVVNTALTIYTGYSIYQAGWSLSASTAAGEIAKTGFQASAEWVQGINVFWNSKDIATSPTLITAAQNCHMKSL